MYSLDVANLLSDTQKIQCHTLMSEKTTPCNQIIICKRITLKEETFAVFPKSRKFIAPNFSKLFFLES